MRKQKEDIPLEYFERNWAITLVFLTITAFLAYMAYVNYKVVSQLTIIYGIPFVFFFFLTLWLMLNPYAVIFEDKFEMKRTILSNRDWYFIDIKSVSEVAGKGFKIIYNDDDEEWISLFGMKASHKKKFRDVVNHYVCKSLVIERPDDE